MWILDRGNHCCLQFGIVDLCLSCPLISALFVRFSKIHTFEKPNDERALRLMNACATSMLEKFPDIVFAYGVSDEYRYNIFSWNFQFEFFQSP